MAISSVMLLHGYRYPKQGYQGALTYVRERLGPNDLACAVGSAAVAYRNYYAPDLCFPESVAVLDGLRRPGRTVWVLYSFRRFMSGATPELHRYVTRELKHVATFPGTLGGRRCSRAAATRDPQGRHIAEPEVWKPMTLISIEFSCSGGVVNCLVCRR